MDNRFTRPSLLQIGAVIAVCLAGSGCHFKSQQERAAEAILARNAEARGGLEAWRAVRAMSLSGKLEAGAPRDPLKQAMAYLKPQNVAKAEARRALTEGAVQAPEPQTLLPFTIELQRPRYKRVELVFQGQTAVQVYDGTHGWKLRPFLGRREVEEYSPEEMRQASLETDLDGPLLDYADKGSRVELEGSETIDGKAAHRLKVTLANGQERRVWVDQATALDVRIDGSRKMDGKLRTAWTTYRDFRKVEGVLVPFLLETTVEGVKGSEKILVERVAINPGLPLGRFAKPE
jgi:hypothetical protein